MKRSFALALIAVTAGISPPAALAQTATKALPKADTILTQYVEATGGKAAYEKIKSRVATGTIEVPAANIKGKIEVSQAARRYSPSSPSWDRSARPPRRPTARRPGKIRPSTANVRSKARKRRRSSLKRLSTANFGGRNCTRRSNAPASSTSRASPRTKSSRPRKGAMFPPSITIRRATSWSKRVRPPRARWVRSLSTSTRPTTRRLTAS